MAFKHPKQEDSAYGLITTAQRNDLVRVRGDGKGVGDEKGKASKRS